MHPDLILTSALTGSGFPPAATTVDNAFAWGAVFLLIVLIAWRGRST